MSKIFAVWEEDSHDGADNLHNDVDWKLGVGRHPFLCRLLFQRRDFGSSLCPRNGYGTTFFSIGLVVVILTAFYSWRLLILTFHGTPRADDRVMAHVHEAPQSMKIPLYILAFGSIVSGYLGHDLFLSQEFWGRAVASVVSGDDHLEPDFIPYWVLCLPLLCAVLGMTVAYYFYDRMKQYRIGWPRDGTVFTCFPSIRDLWMNFMTGFLCARL